MVIVEKSRLVGRVPACNSRRMPKCLISDLSLSGGGVKKGDKMRYNRTDNIR
jgi:hypothetical protein